MVTHPGEKPAASAQKSGLVVRFGTGSVSLCREITGPKRHEELLRLTRTPANVALVNKLAAAEEMFDALKLALPELEQEAEQRETSGNDEYSAGIRKVATAAADALGKAEGLS